MTGETPPDPPSDASPGQAASPAAPAAEGRRADPNLHRAEGDAAGQSAGYRPSSRKAISGSRSSSIPPYSPQPASSPHNSPIPPPAALPRVPGIDALMNAEAMRAVRRRSRRIVNQNEEVDSSKMTNPDSSDSEEDVIQISSFDDDDEVTNPVFQRPQRPADRPLMLEGIEEFALARGPSGELDADFAPGGSAALASYGQQGEEPDAKADDFVALAPPLGSPLALAGASSTAPATHQGHPAPPSADEEDIVELPEDAAESAPGDDASVIQPMRIINIGSGNDVVEVSARTSSLPPGGNLSPRRSSRPPAGLMIDDDDFEVDALVEEDEPVTQPAEGLVKQGRAEDVDPIEEIDFDRITVVDPIEPYSPSMSTLNSPSQAKKPPPPPPKRAPGGEGPNSRPSPGRDSATPGAVPAAPTSNPGAGAPAASSFDKGAVTSDPGRKRQKAWWEDLFGDDFTRTMDHVEPKGIRKECDFIEERLGLEKGAVMLDLGCGIGVHAVELASRSYSVVGYDLSLAMLARAADEAQDRGQKINFLHGDMREMAFEETFDGVYCWSMTFGYFDDEKNLNVLSRIHRALRKGGMLLLDVTNRDYVAPRQPSLVWFEGDGCVCMDEMHVDFFASRLRVKRTVMFEDGRSKEVDYSIRLYALHELGKMLHECGFKVVEVTGHPAHPGVFFGSESPRIIILAERD